VSYLKILKTLTSHLTAHGMPIDPIGWSVALDERVKLGGPQAEAAATLRPLPLLLSEGERIRCAWTVDRATGEILPSVDALSTMAPNVRHMIGDGRRAVLALSADVAPLMLAKLSGDAALSADVGVGVGLLYLKLAQSSGDKLTLGEAPRAFAAWRKWSPGHGVEAVAEVFAACYPVASAWLEDHRSALTRAVNESIVSWCAAGLRAPGELVAVLGGVAFVMTPATAADVAATRDGWAAALGGGVKVDARIGWSFGALAPLPPGPLGEDWSMSGAAPFSPSPGLSARVALALSAIRDGAGVDALSEDRALNYGLQLASLTAPEELRAASAAAPADVRRSLRALGEAARALANPRTRAALSGVLVLKIGDHDEAAGIMLDWYTNSGFQLLALADKLFTSQGATWREVCAAERAENVCEALRGALVEGEKGDYPLRLNMNFVEGVDAAMMNRVTSRLIQEHEGAYDGLASPFDRPSQGVPLRDGLLSEDGLIRPITPEDRILAATVLDLGYDPGAACPRWLRFLGEVWAGCDDAPQRIAFLREWLGAALFGVATKRRGFPLLIGARRCGKSTLIEVVKRLFPESACSAVTMDRLNGQEAQKSTHSLFGKRLNAVTEHPAGHLPDAAIFKQVVMGESVAAKSLYRDEYTFRPQAAWILAMNDLPTITDTSGAALDRIVPLTFSRQFAEDDTIGAALAAERMGIVLWALEGLRSLKGRTAYTAVPSAQAARGDWHTASDSVAAYVAENMRNTGEAPAREVRIRISTLYTDYAQWCKDGGYKNPVNVNGFSKRLKALEPAWVSAPVRTKPLTGSVESSTTARAILVTHLRLCQETDLP